MFPRLRLTMDCIIYRCMKTIHLSLYSDTVQDVCGKASGRKSSHKIVISLSNPFCLMVYLPLAQSLTGRLLFSPWKRISELRLTNRAIKAKRLGKFFFRLINNAVPIQPRLHCITRVYSTNRKTPVCKIFKKNTSE